MRRLLGRLAPQPLRRIYRRLRGVGDPNGMWERIKAMRVRYQLRNPICPPDFQKRILFNSQFAWSYGIVEYTLAAALRERGHDVRMVACGGLPRYCELMTSAQDRPPCGECHANVCHKFDAFGLPHIAAVQYLTDADRAEALAMVSEAGVDQLRAMVDDDVPVGEIAFLNLFQYLKGYPFEITGAVARVFRDAVQSGILVSRASARILDEYRPHVVATTNGKFLQWAPIIVQARKRNIQFMTWEDNQVRPASVEFASNELAHEKRHLSVWKEELERPLSDKQLQDLRDHFQMWSRGEVTPWAGYAPTGRDESQVLRERLALRNGAPIIALYPNVSWDASSVGFEKAFSSMYEWLYTVVAYAARRPELEFVIRAHPAEARLPEVLRPPVPVCEAVRRNFPVLPANLRLIEGGDSINSYALAKMASVNMVYTSTLGIELPMRGIRPWVAAGAYYAGKGFTVDLESAEHMCALLDADAFANELDEDQVMRAERFAYLVRFRGLFDFPLMPAAGEFSAASWADLAPNGNAVLATICEKLLAHEAFIDLESAPMAVSERHSAAGASV